MKTVSSNCFISIAYYRKLTKKYIFIELRKNEIFINELKPSKLFMLKKNEDLQELSEMNTSDFHLSIFINGKYL